MDHKKIILASSSQSRKAMLTQAGLRFDIVPSQVDEEAIKRKGLAAGKKPVSIAQALAEAKALEVSQKHPESLVIGADQMLECDGAFFSKAKDREDARAKLSALKGRNHRLLCAVSVARGGRILWGYTDEASLSMHDFDDALLDRYCEIAGSGLTGSVGGYEMEGYGAWLFKKVEGDYFTILGLPLLPLLHYLHVDHGLHP